VRSTLLVQISSIWFTSVLLQLWIIATCGVATP